MHFTSIDKINETPVRDFRIKALEILLKTRQKKIRLILKQLVGATNHTVITSRTTISTPHSSTFVITCNAFLKWLSPSCFAYSLRFWPIFLTTVRLYLSSFGLNISKGIIFSIISLEMSPSLPATSDYSQRN